MEINIEKDLCEAQLYYIVSEHCKLLYKNKVEGSEYYTKYSSCIFNMDELINIWDEYSKKYTSNIKKETLQKYVGKIFFIEAEVCAEDNSLADDGFLIYEVFFKKNTKDIYLDKDGIDIKLLTN